MTITKERKQEIIQDFRHDDQDTGSPEVQIAILTTRINSLTEHMRTSLEGLCESARTPRVGQPPPLSLGLFAPH